jgi:hypothetical protein
LCHKEAKNDAGFSPWVTRVEISREGGFLQQKSDYKAC